MKNNKKKEKAERHENSRHREGKNESEGESGNQ